TFALPPMFNEAIDDGAQQRRSNQWPGQIQCRSDAREGILFARWLQAPPPSTHCDVVPRRTGLQDGNRAPRGAQRAEFVAYESCNTPVEREEVTRRSSIGPNPVKPGC